MVGTLGQPLLPSRPAGQWSAPSLGSLRALSGHIDPSSHSPKGLLLVLSTRSSGICWFPSILDILPPSWKELMTHVQRSIPSCLPHWIHCPTYPDHSHFHWSTLDPSPDLPLVTLPERVVQQVETGTGALISPFPGSALSLESLLPVPSPPPPQSHLACWNLHTVLLSSLALTPETQAPTISLFLLWIQ